MYFKYLIGIIYFAISFASKADEIRTVNQAIFTQNTIIVCCAEEAGKCRGPFHTLSSGYSSNLYSPYEYAGLAGYWILHRVGFMATDHGCDKYLLEVSR